MIERVDKKTGKIYLYQSICVWDPIAGRPKTKQTYIGSKNPDTGEISPPKRQFRKVKPELEENTSEGQAVLSSNTTIVTNNEQLSIIDDQTISITKIAGPFILLEKLSDSLGIKNILNKVFKDKYPIILSLAYYIANKGNPLYKFTSWSEKHMHPYNNVVQNQRITELLDDITEDQIQQFNKLWLKKVIEKDNLCYDITSISSYATANEFIRYGYNRDGDKLPQINLAVLFGQSSGLPAYHRRMPGNITDVITLEKTIQHLDFLSLKHITFILDKGFYSLKNISLILDKKSHFTISVPIDRKWVKKYLDLSYEKIINPMNFFEFGEDDLIYAKCFKHNWESPHRRLYLHIFFQNIKKSEDINDFMKSIIKLKSQIETNNIDKKLYNRFIKYLIIENKKNNKCVVKFNQLEIDNYTHNYTGYFCLLSSNINDSIEALTIYRNKDKVENSFDDLKNHLDLKRLRIHTSSRMDSRIFIQFISLILISELRNTAKNKPKLKYLSNSEIFDELESLYVITFKNRYGRLYSECSPKQSMILDSFELNWPLKS
ncbi:MAG: transposase [Rickettsiales bacterium]|nr:transposase [Rickettsiales bacterium]